MFWYDGKLLNTSKLQLDFNEPGLCYGATCFTTIRVYDGSLDHPLTSWQAHCDRLKTTISIFNWQQPHWQQLKQGAQILAKQFLVLRITIFPDGREWITGRTLPSALEQLQTSGITAWIADDSLYCRNLPQHKTGNYLARNQALNLGAQEAILVNTQGNWLETSTGNLWGWQNGCWYTPKLESGILPGIARSRWLHFFGSRKTKVEENIWTPEFVLTIEALAYSNCVVDWVPITTVLGREGKTDYTIQQPG